MSCRGINIGDIIIGNEFADKRYAITRKGWIGIVTFAGRNTFRAKSIKKDKTEYGDLDYNCFNLCFHSTARDLAIQLGLYKEEYYDNY